MSEELNARCNGDCDSCGSDCESKDSGTTITLQMDNGENVECIILTTFALDEREYIVLLPLDEEGKAEGEEVYIYRYGHSEEGNSYLENIADEDEYEEVAKAFEEYIADLQLQDDLGDIVENTSAN